MKNLLYIVIGAGFLGIISSSASGFLTTETSDTLDNLYEENFYIDPESVEVGDDKVKVLLYQVNTNNAEKKINDCLNFYKSEYKDKTINMKTDGAWGKIDEICKLKNQFFGKVSIENKPSFKILEYCDEILKNE